MRIVQMLESLDIGGQERFAVDLAREQRRAGHEPSIYCLLGGGPLVDTARRDGIPVHLVERKGRRSATAMVRLIRQLRRDSPDVVHTHNPGVHAYGAIAARVAGVRTIINTVHGVTTSTGKPHAAGFFRPVIRLTNQFVFVSEHARNAVAEAARLPLARCCVVRNGISFTAFKEPACPGTRAPRVRFCAVGRLVPVKAHRVLIEAFAIAVRRNPEIELSIAGSGPLLADITGAVKALGVDSQVDLVGECHDVPRFLRAHDVFVLPSTSEGLPIAVLEAMAIGLPIVATRVGGVPEVAPEGAVAWYCEPGNVETLADALCTAAASPDLAARGHAAREIAWTQYDIVRAGEAYMGVYRDAARGQ